MDSESLSDVEWRASVHAALGDPARLAIVDMLTLGDASPGEIAERLAMPTNLVAHHLGVLQHATVVARTRSEGDRRRTYVHLNHATLARLGARPATLAVRVVFVCTHNTARSQLAAALWASRSQVPTTSAGTDPAPAVHPRTLTVARRHQLRLGRPRTAHVADVIRPGDLVVAVCDDAHEHLPPDPTRLHWSVPDPAPADTDHAFETAYADLAARVNRLAPKLSGSTP
jgi:ArsR family transcriptional regulator, arsenate/arsenite/antimonite-responsive transcriptional repressor / arsenate reductase (thioredoxin)